MKKRGRENGERETEWKPCENCVSRVSFPFFNSATLASRDEKRVNVNRERENDDENDKCSDVTILHIRARVCTVGGLTLVSADWRLLFLYLN